MGWRPLGAFTDWPHVKTISIVSKVYKPTGVGGPLQVLVNNNLRQWVTFCFSQVPVAIPFPVICSFPNGLFDSAFLVASIAQAVTYLQSDFEQFVTQAAWLSNGSGGQTTCILTVTEGLLIP